MKRNKSRQKRVWLAPSDSTSFSSASYSIDKYDEESVNVRIADCNKIINLWCEGKRGIKKLDRLIGLLQEARNELNTEINGE